MKKLFKKGIGVLAIAGLVLAGCGGAGTDDATITIGETPWTSTVPPTYIAKQILEDMGYEVKVQAAEAGVVYTGLSNGDIDVFMDAWLPDTHKEYMDKYGDKIDITSLSYPDGELGLVVPTYLEDINSVEDLIGKEDLFGNQIIGIDEGAGITETSREVIEGYDLDLDYAVSSESAMLAQAKKSIRTEEPILFVGWRPHTMFIDLDLKILDDPKGFFKTSDVNVVTHKGFAEKAPEAYAFLSKWSIPVDDIERMISEMDEGATKEEVAKKWIEENEDKVKEMIGQ
ncbi:glycine/betaine ABC transporter substrate-binding protein [Ammoniphilus oxalaticus]|uniref:Glycine/betaine ABC transporter substrate-binding protein n=1 Tax=Ammoniphilus oxalaticus TaxID=66863 RepID=A0A419SG20_9BACL|nr:glycine betaine ABC transporter substrate-binding protein [Ammoniphilus oxalaticus]RKD22726.1 glycine/betaine ABC transporter substrate-binding protein [Ammoniphilus oxalaticus]